MGAKKVLLAGGGTAGHVEPALAVGRWILDNYPSTTIEFLGTKSGLEKDLVPAAGFILRTIEKAPLPRRLNAALIQWPFKFVLSLKQTWRALSGVDLLIGFGGYVSSSAYICAKARRIPIILHEANAKPGWANTLGAKLGATTLIAFESTSTFGTEWKSSTVVGIPLRSEIVLAAHLSPREREDIRRKKAEEWGFNFERPIVVAFGGSLGSQHMNSVIAAALPLITQSGIQLVHAVGRLNELPPESANYKPIHYFTDLPDAYCAADLVISRSGAVTCHELAAIGVYSLLIPLPVGNGEQKFNGQSLVESGAATMISNREFTPEWLSAHLLGLISAGKKLRGEHQGAQVPLDATERIGALVKPYLEGR